MAPTTSSPQPQTALFITFLLLFLLTLLLSLLSLYHLHTRQKLPKEASSSHLDLELAHPLSSHPNPHPFGTERWRTHETALAPQHEIDALMIASQKAQIAMLEQSGDLLGKCVEMLVERNRMLEGRRVGEEEGEGGEGGEQPLPENIDEILRRVREEIEAPIIR